MEADGTLQPARAIRDRVKEFRRIRAGELQANPANWRRHPKSQSDALRGILEEIGFAGAVLAYEAEDGLTLIDGHLRADVDADMELPVLILDVDDTEALKLMATFDPLGAMAQTDQEAFTELLGQVEFEDEAINAMLDSLASGAEAQPIDWQGMPEFHQEDQLAWKQLIINFAGPNDLQDFARLVGQKITPETKSIWFPQAETFHGVDTRFIEGEDDEGE